MNVSAKRIMFFNVLITLAVFAIIFISFLVFKNPNYKILLGQNEDKASKIYLGEGSYEYIDFKSLMDENTFIKRKVKVRHSLVIKNYKLFDVEYKTDIYGRRFMPLASKSNQFLIVSGCSFVFGLGLDAENSLPYKLQEKLPGYKVYNYGIPGAGTNHILAKIESNTFHKEVQEKSGIFIYVFIDGHIPRTMGSLGPIVKESAPYYKWKNNEPIRDGTFGSAEPAWTWLRTTILQSWLSQVIGIEHYNYIPTSSIQKTCKMIKKAQIEFNKQYPSSRFLVFFHPAEANTYKKLGPCLNSEKVDYLVANYEHNSDLQIPYDLHPNTEGNAKTAGSISDSISKLTFENENML